ncbi:MAG TPA: hypothetical protein VIE43_01245 [Thermoanaerobaculia bacterium]|jgi:hypothetical protein|nr:hypothetical protein [Thermoanaerobaculia bacterium]
MRRPRFARPWILALALPGLGVAHAGTISGQFVIGGKPVPVKEIAAFRMRDQSNPRTVETYVMLTAKPVNTASISASLDPYAVAINDPAVRDDDYLSFNVRANGETSLNAHVGGTQYIDTSGTIMGHPGSLIVKCRENTPTHIACNVKTANPVKALDGPTWSMDVSFEADVVSRAPGKAMAKDGEAPGKALLALRDAVGGTDLAKILALLTPGEAKSYQEDWRSPAENLASAKEILNAQLPKQPKITGGERVADDRAVLEVEGVPYEHGHMLYLVEMRLINGNWVYESSSVAGMLRAPDEKPRH